MPTTLPNISIEEAKKQLERQDEILRAFPEVKTVFGKVGRAETPTIPRRSRWSRPWCSSSRRGGVAASAGTATGRRLVRASSRRARGASADELVAKMNAATKMPGWTNAFTLPIKARIDMLTTGIRTPVGIKVFGSDLEHDRVGTGASRGRPRDVPGTRSVLFERALGGLYVDILPRRDALARFGLHVDDVNGVIESALGGIASRPRSRAASASRSTCATPKTFARAPIRSAGRSSPTEARHARSRSRTLPRCASRRARR